MRKIIFTKIWIFCIITLLCLSSSALATEQIQATDNKKPIKMVPVYVPAGPSEKVVSIPAKLDMNTVSQVFKDIPYASVSTRNKLDIYLPAIGQAPYPVVMNIHGGAFMRGDKGDYKLNAPASALSRGYAVVSINYRLSGEAPMPAAIYDVKAAIRWVKANAKQYGFDPDRIAVWGDSTGGNLAAMMGTTSHGVPLLEDLSMGNAEQNSSIAAAIIWFANIDFLAMDDQFRKSGLGKPDKSGYQSTASQYLWAPITEAPFLCKVANPTSYITPGPNPYFLIQHGTLDHIVPFEQSINFANELKKVIGEDKVTFIPIVGAKHVPPDVEYFHSPENLKIVLDFLDEHLK